MELLRRWQASKFGMIGGQQGEAMPGHGAMTMRQASLRIPLIGRCVPKRRLLEACPRVHSVNMVRMVRMNGRGRGQLLVHSQMRIPSSARKEHRAEDKEQAKPGKHLEKARAKLCSKQYVFPRASLAVVYGAGKSRAPRPSIGNASEPILGLGDW
jgi:hypothetical protein